MVTAERRRFAVIVDGVEGIVPAPDDRRRPGAVRPEGLPAFLDGVAFDGETAIQLVRLRALLGPEELGLLADGHD